MTWRDMVIEDYADQIAALEDQHVADLQAVSGYQQLAVVAVARVATLTAECDRLRARLADYAARDREERLDEVA